MERETLSGICRNCANGRHDYAEHNEFGCFHGNCPCTVPVIDRRRASARVRTGSEREAGLDVRAIVEALGFDPTNHHNAAKCPYCSAAPTGEEEPRPYPCIWCGTPLNVCGDPPCCPENDHPYATIRETLAALHEDIDRAWVETT